MSRFFITIQDYTPSNILDQRLQKEMTDMFRHMIVTDDDVQNIESQFEHICKEYKKEGGRAKMFFSLAIKDASHIRYTVGTKQKTSMYIDLTLIRGNVE